MAHPVGEGEQGEPLVGTIRVGTSSDSGNHTGFGEPVDLTRRGEGTTCLEAPAIAT